MGDFSFFMFTEILFDVRFSEGSRFLLFVL